jgi:hypothetical protein
MRPAAFFILAAYFGACGYVIAKSGADKRMAESVNQLLDRRIRRDMQIMKSELGRYELAPEHSTKENVTSGATAV